MQVTAIDGHNARCETHGVEREVSLYLIQDEPVQPGDFVLVHVGYAIQKLDAEEAKASMELFDQLFAEDDAGA